VNAWEDGHPETKSTRALEVKLYEEVFKNF
jgi:hypothetical protein